MLFNEVLTFLTLSALGVDVEEGTGAELPGEQEGEDGGLERVPPLFLFLSSRSSLLYFLWRTRGARNWEATGRWTGIGLGPVGMWQDKYCDHTLTNSHIDHFFSLATEVQALPPPL